MINESNNDMEAMTQIDESILFKFGFGQKSFGGKYNLHIGEKEKEGHVRIGYRYINGTHIVDSTSRFMKSGVLDSVGGKIYQGESKRDAMIAIQARINLAAV